MEVPLLKEVPLPPFQSVLAGADGVSSVLPICFWTQDKPCEGNAEEAKLED